MISRIQEIIEKMDDESRSFILTQLWSQSRTAGGFRDKKSWNKLRIELEKYPEVKEMKRALAKRLKELDDAPLIKVIKP